MMMFKLNFYKSIDGRSNQDLLVKISIFYYQTCFHDVNQMTKKHYSL